MKSISALSIGLAGLAAFLAVTAYGQVNTSASDTAAKEAVDAKGNLHVPADYRTTYQIAKADAFLTAPCS